MIYILTRNQRKLAAPIKQEEDLLEYLKSIKEVGVDIETTGLKPREDSILTVQFGDRNTQFLIEYDKYYIDLLSTILKMDHLTFIFQNGKFDLQFLYLATNTVPLNIYDTMIAERVINMGRITPASLLHLADKYLGIKMQKQVRALVKLGLTNEQVVKYSAEDVEVLPGIKSGQMAFIEKLKIEKAIDLENAFVRVLAYMELCGIYLDSEKWETKCKEDEDAYHQQEDILNQWVIDNTNRLKLFKFAIAQPDLFNPRPICNVMWTSPQQVIALFKAIGIDTTTVDDTTGELKDSVEAPVLQYQAQRFPIIPLYLKYKELQKNVSTYGRNFFKHISPITGRIHSKFNQLVDTGRLSSGGKDKAAKLEYINLQNIPGNKRTRSCIVPDKGNILICADYSQQEQVIFVNRNLDEKLLEFYDSNLGDMHSFVASKIFPPSFAEISKSQSKKDNEEPLTPEDKVNLEYRKKAKAAGFAMNYGGNGKTIAENLGISDEEGDQVYNDFFKAFPGIDNYFKEVKRKALRSGYITINPITQRKYFINYYKDYKALERVVRAEGFWDRRAEEKLNRSESYENYYAPMTRNYFRIRSKIEKTALNAPIQGSAAEITKLAAIFIFEEIIKNNWLFKVLLTNLVHDEVVLESPKEFGEKVRVITEESMKRAGTILGCKRVPLNAGAALVEWWDH